MMGQGVDKRENRCAPGDANGVVVSNVSLQTGGRGRTEFTFDRIQIVWIGAGNNNGFSNVESGFEAALQLRKTTRGRHESDAHDLLFACLGKQTGHLGSREAEPVGNLLLSETFEVVAVRDTVQEAMEAGVSDLEARRGGG
jgi:hypothetical protein